MSSIKQPESVVQRAPLGTSLNVTDLPPPGHFINGAFTGSLGADCLEVVNPATEEVLCEVALGTEGDVDLAVSAASSAKRAWARVAPKKRAELLHAAADRLADNKDVLLRLESADTGKPVSVARDDVEGAIDTFRFMAGALRATTSMAAGDYVESHLSVILREPLGVVAAVTPWNFPLLMAAQKIAAILAAGNTLVLKPSEETPLTTLKVAELVADLLPPGVLNIVCGLGPVVGSSLARHPDVDMISLTGSVNSGRAVAQDAAQTLKRVHLELGGKAPVVVFADADLALVSATLRTASFYNSGQDCGAACRVLAHESIASELADRLVAHVQEMVVGAPEVGVEVEVGPLVSKAQYERVLDHLSRASDDGARAAVGGASFDGPGYFIQPTVLVDVPAGAACTMEEIFGPVVTIETFSSEDEAVERANEGLAGLSASVWTNDARRSHDMASRLDAGTVWVNCHSVLASEVPWGGFKGSGYGRDMSIYALDDYSRTKHVMHYHGR